MTMPVGFWPTNTGTPAPGSPADSGAWIVGAPFASRSTLTMRFDADATTKPVFERCANAAAHGTARNTRDGLAASRLMPRFMLIVAPSVSVARSITDRNDCTLTLKRTGPFGDAAVFGR